MSLINQMLRDLEERSAPQLNEHADTIKGIAWTASKSRAKRQHILAIGIISVLCTGIAVAGYLHLKEDAAPVAMISGDKAVYAIEEVPQVEKSNSIKPVVDSEKTNDADARKMLAALVASGALAEKKSVTVSRKKIPEKIQVATSEPIQLAANDVSPTETSDVAVEKKLRPLDNSKLAEIAYQKGYELIASGQQSQAEKKLRHALELVSTHAKAREVLAVMYLQQQRITEAASVLQEGMKVTPAYLPFREIYARVLMAQNQLPQAIAMLSNDAPDVKTQPNYHALLAGLYQQNQQHEQAASTYLKLVKQNPQQSQWWLGMAISLEKMDKKAEAVSAYKKARELKLPARLMKYVNSRLQFLDAGHVAE